MSGSDLNVARQLIELERIEQALLRMEQGTYGYCLSCGSKINLLRLSNDPAEQFCQSCDGRQAHETLSNLIKPKAEL